MATFAAGQLLKELREKKGLSTKQVCVGICSPSALSRIENGQQKPHHFVFEGLMARLGYSPEKYYFGVTSQDEFALISRLERIEGLIYDREFEEAQILLVTLERKYLDTLNAEYSVGRSAEAKDDPKKTVSRMQLQLLIKVRAVIDFNLTKDYPNVLNMLYRALSLTIPDYDEDKLETYLLSVEEASIVNWLACTYDELGEVERAIDLFYKLKESLDRYYTDEREKAKIYTSLLHNLTKCLGQQSRHTEVIELCDIGLRSCIKSRMFRFAPYLAVNKACALFYKGEAEAGKELLRYAYGALKIHGEDKVADILREVVLNEFQIEV